MTQESTDLLRKGDKGDAVRALQIRLQRLELDPGTSDGIFGPATEAAVKRFQESEGLPADGIVGPMTRNRLRQTPDYRGMQAIARGIKFNHTGRYVLGAGGTNPNQSTPFTWKGAQYGSDCVGFLLWCLGVPRHVETFPEYEGDINCDSAMMDAGIHPTQGGYGTGAFFKPVERKDVVPGCIVVYPSIRAHELSAGTPAQTKAFWEKHGFAPSKRVRIGHIGFVTGWEGLKDPFATDRTPWDGDLKKLITLECRASYPAVRMARNTSFVGRDKYTRYGETWTNPKWDVRFLTYVGP
jgi:hypothetical protein